MTPDQLTRAGIRMYGRRHWKRDMATQLGVDRTTVHRWAHLPAGQDVPARVEVCVLALLERHKQLLVAERIRREREARENHRYRGKDTFRKRPARKPEEKSHVAATQDDEQIIYSVGGADGAGEDA